MKGKKGIKWFSNWQLVLLSTAVFAVFILFVDRDNFFVARKLEKRLEELRAHRDYLVLQIREDSAVVQGIRNDPAFLEKYARENFYMLREGETVFLIEESPAEGK